jgi:hypothetical protein
LFSSALLFYIRNQIAGGISDEFIPVAEEVPLEAQPVKVFVEDCVRRVGKEALVQIGLHGGYIDPNDESLTGKNFLVGIDPTESDALALFENENAKIPYWWYLKSENDCSGNCEFGSNRPALRKDSSGNSIEGQLDKYIERELAKCINNFQQFKEQGFIITERGPMKSDARVAEKEVLLLLDYPISVELQGRKTDISQFYTKLDINFREIYNFATDITNSEIQMYFLELHAMNMIATYSWPASTDKIPPIADFTWGFGDYKIWTRTETQQKIESNVLTVGVPMIQINGSRNYRRDIMITRNKEGKYSFDKLGQALVDKSTVFLNSSVSYGSIAADFTYLDWWPIYLNINNQEVLAPRSVQGSDILSFIGANEYRFWYDMSFPVMVTLNAPDAFEGTGYTFRFALEGNIRDNNHTSPTYVSLANDTGKKLACNLNQRNTDIIHVETKDALTGGPVPARVDFVLGNDACVVGFTRLDADNRSVLDARFPVGWGALSVNNISYLTYQDRFITRDGEGGNLTLKLMPYRFINASVFTKPLNYQDKRYIMPLSAPVSPIDPGKEKAMILFTRMEDDLLSEFTTFLGVESSTERSVMKLVPGTYKVRGFLFYESKQNPIRVPKEQVTYEMFWSDDVTIELNETVFEQYPRGGVVFDNTTSFLTIDAGDLYNSDRVVFYVLRFPPPITHSESMKNGPGLEQISKVAEYTSIYINELQPDWLR